jgi:hypothetical protein
MEVVLAAIADGGMPHLADPTISASKSGRHEGASQPAGPRHIVTTPKIGGKTVPIPHWTGTDPNGIAAAYCIPAHLVGEPVVQSRPINPSPAAMALNGVSYNIARSFGPAIGGIVVAAADAVAAFAAGEGTRIHRGTSRMISNPKLLAVVGQDLVASPADPGAVLLQALQDD